MSPRLFAVVTTIQEPTDCVRGLADALRGLDAPLVAVGDRRGQRASTWTAPGSCP